MWFVVAKAKTGAGLCLIDFYCRDGRVALSLSYGGLAWNPRVCREMALAPEFLLGRNLAEGTPVFYDRFSSGAMNGHMVVMAGSTWDRLLFTRLMVIREAQRGLACLPD